jgi:hypothetical protein
MINPTEPNYHMGDPSATNETKQTIQYFHSALDRNSQPRRRGGLWNGPPPLVRTRHRTRARNRVPRRCICAPSNRRIRRHSVRSIEPPTPAIKRLGALPADGSISRCRHSNNRARLGVRRIRRIGVGNRRRWPGSVLGELVGRDRASARAARLPRLERRLERVTRHTLRGARPDRLARVARDPAFFEPELVRPKRRLDFAGRTRVADLPGPEEPVLKGTKSAKITNKVGKDVPAGHPCSPG